MNSTFVSPFLSRSVWISHIPAPAVLRLHSAVKRSPFNPLVVTCNLSSLTGLTAVMRVLLDREGSSVTGAALNQYNFIVD